MSDLYKYFLDEKQNKENNQPSADEQHLPEHLIDETSIETLIENLDDKDFISRLKNLCSPKLQSIFDDIQSGKTLRQIAGDSHSAARLKTILEQIGRAVDRDIYWYKYVVALDKSDPDEGFRLRKRCTRTDEIRYMRGEYLTTGKTPRKINKGQHQADEDDWKSMRFRYLERTFKR